MQGSQASMAAKSALLPLALSATDYAEHERLRRAPAMAANVGDALPLGKLTILGTGFTNPQALAAETGLQPGQKVSKAQIDQGSATLQGRGDFDRIDTQVVDVDGRRDVTLSVSEAAWSRSRLRLGFEVESDFDSSNVYALTLLHTLSWINAWGAELRTLARIGTTQQLDMGFHQPLGAGSAWYVEPQLTYQSIKTYMPLFGSNLRATTGWSGVVLGRRLGIWGDVQLGAGEQTIGLTVNFPPGFEDAAAGLNRKVTETTQEARFRIDTLDAPAFPGRGYLFDLHTQRLTSGEDSGEMPYELKAMAAFQLGTWAGHLYGEYAQASTHGNVADDLGGFLRVSGSAPRGPQSQEPAISSQALVRWVMAKQFGQMPLGLGGALRAGFSLESGSSASGGKGLGGADWRKAASIFASVDTRLGPFYLALGSTQGGASTVYFFLGPVW